MRRLVLALPFWPTRSRFTALWVISLMALVLRPAAVRAEDPDPRGKTEALMEEVRPQEEDFAVGKRCRVMINSDPAYYPRYYTSYQTSDGKVWVKYLRKGKGAPPASRLLSFVLTDPPDPSEYVNGTVNDNLDSIPTTYQVSTVIQELAQGDEPPFTWKETAEVEVDITKQKAGDNYRIEVRDVAKLLRVTAILTGWKGLNMPIYRMHNDGATIVSANVAGLRLTLELDDRRDFQAMPLGMQVSVLLAAEPIQKVTVGTFAGLGAGNTIKLDFLPGAVPNPQFLDGVFITGATYDMDVPNAQAYLDLAFIPAFYAARLDDTLLRRLPKLHWPEPECQRLFLPRVGRGPSISQLVIHARPPRPGNGDVIDFAVAYRIRMKSNAPPGPPAEGLPDPSEMPDVDWPSGSTPERPVDSEDAIGGGAIGCIDVAGIAFANSQGLSILHC